MSRAIISLVGTSLLSNYLEEKFRNGELADFAQEHLKKWDEKKHRFPKDILKALEVGEIEVQDDNGIVRVLSESISFPNLREASAETNTLSKVSIQQDDTLYFISSNTICGKICAQALYRFYENQKIYCVKEPIVIQLLIKDSFKFNEGLRELTDKIVEIIREEKGKGKEVLINATGGYKPESTYATISAILEGVRIVYLHEEFDQNVDLPPIPINFNLTIFHKNASWIKLALQGNREAYDKLPKEVKDLINFQNGSPSFFKPLGAVLWNAYLFAISPRGRVFPKSSLIDQLTPPHRRLVLKFIEKWDSLWTGDQVPQMVDHQHSHCQNVLNFAEQALLLILGEDANFLKEKELFFLISAIFLHDIGHSETTDKDGNPLLPEDIRKRHGELTYQMIEKDPKSWGFDNFNEEARLIAIICKYHQRDWNLKDLPEAQNQVRVRFLTALLRIFDACDRQISRVGDEDYREMQLRANERERIFCEAILKKKNTTGWFRKYFESKIKFIEKQKEHFRIHSQVSLVRIEPTKSQDRWECKIIYHPVEDQSIKEYEEYILEELNAPCVKKTLSDNHLDFQVLKGECLPR